MEEKTPRGYDEEEEIDLREILFLLQQNFLQILIAAIVGGILAWSVSYFLIAPTYKATAKLYVVSASNNSVINLSDLQLGSTLAPDYQELLLTRPVMESTIQNLHLENETVSSLRSKVDIQNPSSTRILNITITSKDPKYSADIANEIAKLAITWIPSVMESNAPRLAESAVPPTTQASPHCIRNAVIAAVAAAVLLYGYYVVAFLMDDTVRTDEDMERYFGITPMADIPLENKEKSSAKSPWHTRLQRRRKGGGKK